MIHRAKFQNFKALKDVEVTFDSRLTVLVGPNGSGKTSVLRGIYWLCQMATDAQSFGQGLQAVMGVARETYSGQGADQLFELSAGEGAEAVSIRFLTHPPDGRKYKLRHSGTGHQMEDAWWCHLTSVGGESDLHSAWAPQVLQTLRPPFTPAELIQLDSENLAAATLTKTTPPPMASNGTGLASLMAYFKLYDEPRFDQVVELFRRVIPTVQRIRIDRVQTGHQGLGEGLVFDMPGRKGAPASTMSDGTLYALGLIVKILDPQRPKTLLIDDIDHGFHPKAQLTLVELLHKLLDEIPDLQIIATSHSPYILDRLNWNEVRVSSLREDGSAIVARLEDHPDFDRWKDAMSPGEFWSTFYEEWATKTKPALQPVP